MILIRALCDFYPPCIRAYLRLCCAVLCLVVQLCLTLWRHGQSHEENLHLLHILVEFVMSWDLQWWLLTFQLEPPHHSKIYRLVQSGESLRILVPLGGRICPSTAYSWPFLDSTMVLFATLMQHFMCGRNYISYFSRSTRNVSRLILH